MKPKQHMKARTDRPTLPELDQTQKSVQQSDVDAVPQIVPACHG